MKISEYIKINLKKNPHYQKDFFDLINKTYNKNKDPDNFDLHEEQIHSIDNFLNKFFSYRQLMKQENITLKNPNWKNLEELDDKVSEVIFNNKIKKYQKAILREHYNNTDLVNKETFSLFKALYEDNVPKEVINNEISKISAWEEFTQLNAALQKILDEKELTAEIIQQNIDKSEGKAEIVSNEENQVIVRIDDEFSSKDLGSSQWCISYDPTYWEHYLWVNSEEDVKNSKEEENTTFFIFNLNKSKNDPLSKIAITLNESGELIAAHNKDDDTLYEGIVNSIVSRDKRFQLIKSIYEKIDEKIKNSLNHLSPEEFIEFLGDNGFNKLEIAKYYIENELDDYRFDFYEEEDIEKFNTRIEDILDNWLLFSLGKEIIESNPKQTINTIKELKEQDIELAYHNNRDIWLTLLIKNGTKEDWINNKDDITKLLYDTSNEVMSSSINNNQEKSHDLMDSINNELLEAIQSENTAPMFLNILLTTNAYKDKDFFKSCLDKMGDKINYKLCILQTPKILPEISNQLLSYIENKNPDISPFSLDELWNIAGAKWINNDLKKYPHIKKELKEKAFLRDDQFKGNGIYFGHNKTWEKGTSSNVATVKLLNLKKNNLLNKKIEAKQESWLNDFKMRVMSGIDTIVLKQYYHETNIDNLFKTENNKNKVKLN